MKLIMVKCIKDIFYTATFTQNYLAKEIVYRFFKILYTHRHFLSYSKSEKYLKVRVRPFYNYFAFKPENQITILNYDLYCTFWSVNCSSVAH